MVLNSPMMDRSNMRQSNGSSPRRRRGRRSIRRILAIEQHNPVRSLDWRWQLAGKLVNRNALDPPLGEDPHLLDAVVFRRRFDEQRCMAESPPSTEWSPVGQAFEIFSGPDEQRLLLETNLLSREPFEATADYLALPVAVVKAYESLFFNIRDRLGAKDFIVARAIGLPGNEVDPGAVIRAFSYFAGPLILQSIREAGCVSSEAGYLESLSTESGRNITRARLAILAASSRYSVRLATEIGRAMELVRRFEADSRRSAAANSAYGSLIEALTADLTPPAPTDTSAGTGAATAGPKAGEAAMDFGKANAA